MQNHYNCVFDEISKTYNFATKNGILYRLAFIVDQTFSAISGEEITNVFQLVIEKANENIKLSPEYYSYESSSDQKK